MVDVRKAILLYQLPDIQVINIVGQFLDAFLFIYLIQNFFEPKEMRYRSKNNLLGVGILFAVLLFLTDWVMNNNFYAYMIIMIGFPFFYACIFFRGKVMIKALICLIFFTMMYSLENLVYYTAFYFSDNFQMALDTWRILFIFRRIVFKGALFLVLRILMIDVMRANAKIINGYWYFMTAICVTDYIIFNYILKHPVNDRRALTQGLILSVFCILVPIACYYMISLIVKIEEINKVTVAQETWIQMQGEHLGQIEDMQEAIRQFRHDYKAHLFCMDALVVEKNYEELHRYLEKLHQLPMEQMEITPYTQDNSLNLVLNQKKKMAEKYGVDFQIRVEIGTDSNNRGKVQMYDLNALLSNLCDNAIEAAAKVKHGKVSLHLMKKKAYLKIEVENSADGNLLMQNPKFETSKKNKKLHGLGIKIIKNIVEMYDGMYETEITKHCLKTSILLMDE